MCCCYCSSGVASNSSDSSQFEKPTGIFNYNSSQGRFATFLSDSQRSRIWVLGSNFQTDLVAGEGSIHGQVVTARDGLATKSTFGRPVGIVVDPKTNNIYVADKAGFTIRKISAESTISPSVSATTNSPKTIGPTTISPVSLCIGGYKSYDKALFENVQSCINCDTPNTYNSASAIIVSSSFKCALHCDSTNTVATFFLYANHGSNQGILFS